MCQNCVDAGRMTREEMEQQQSEMLSVLTEVAGSAEPQKDAVAVIARDFAQIVQSLGFTFSLSITGGMFTLGLAEASVPGSESRGEVLPMAQWDPNMVRKVLEKGE